jgi:alkanesulfonate monooxygenase SsuD/methylene tetrahydromethanopterin reductase-like flavin-dependent oxidoreductase (luciferase family)
MTKLEFGLFDSFAESEMTQAPADVYEQHIGYARTAEELGYRYYFFIEHQNAPFAYISSPNVYLAALAQHTRSLRFGPMVYQLPMHHPIRLAQDVAMVDQLSRGRLEFGLGYGIHEHEFLRWKLPFPERRDMGLEAMEIITRAWTEESLTYQGKYWQFDEALPKPKPYQKPHPPVWVGAHSPTSFDYAAKHSFHVAQNIDTDAAVAEKFTYFRKVWKAFQHPGPLPHMMLARHVHVAETDAQARAEAEPFLLQGYFGGPRGREIIARTRIGFGKDPRMTGGERTPEIVERGRVFQELGKSYDFWVDNGIALVGSADTVARKVEEQQKRVGYDVLCVQHQLNEMPKELTVKSLKLFGERVIPAFA